MGNAKKSLLVLISIIFILTSCIFLFMGVNTKALENSIYVDSSFHAYRDGSAEHPYEKIQYAINKAQNGDTIYVFGGTYNESLIINKNITLIGSIDKGDTIINRNINHKYMVEITADYVTLESFTITDPKKHNGFALVYISSDNVVIQGNNITNSSRWGLYFFSSNDCTIGDNYINNTKGIYLYSSNNNVFSNNNFSNCKETAISLGSSSEDCIMYNNTFFNNKHAIFGQTSSNNNVSQNIMMRSNIDGIKLYQGSNNFIKNNTIRKSGNNAIFITTSNSKIIDNTLDSNQVGIRLEGSNCEVVNNTIKNSTIWGIYVASGSINNLIYLNRLRYNGVNAKEDGNGQWYSANQGNYWDDYNDVDKDLDKIGDVPYIVSSKSKDLYPLGFFLKPPLKPEDPSPKDGSDEVGLAVTLSVTVEDPDSNMLDVYFYGAADEKLYGKAYHIQSGEEAKCSFTLNFQTTFLWYAVVDDGKLENQSDIWIFTTKQIPPTNKKPVANPGGPYIALLNEEISFDGAASYDPDGNIDFYRWNFGDGSSEILDIYPTHIYAEAGLYIVTLTVVDNEGRTNTATTTATVTTTFNNPPVTIISGPSSINVSQKALFDASGSYDTDGNIINYTWNFGDGTIGFGISSKHTYSNAGTYTVMVSITDDEGGKDSSYLVITVKKPPEGLPGFEFILTIIAFSLILGIRKWRK
jgi:parallel beta-helix repeat protein